MGAQSNSERGVRQGLCSGMASEQRDLNSAGSESRRKHCRAQKEGTTAKALG